MLNFKLVIFVITVIVAHGCADAEENNKSLELFENDPMCSNNGFLSCMKISREACVGILEAANSKCEHNIRSDGFGEDIAIGMKRYSS